MSFAYFHVVTNHLPIIGVPFALFLLLLGIWWRSDELKTASFLIFTLLGIATLGVYLLGLGGEDFVEDLAGVSEDAIENHKKYATVALISIEVLAALSIFALLHYSKLEIFRRSFFQKLLIDDLAKTRTSNFPKWLMFLVLTIALASGAIFAFTGKLGGMIRHTEFYGGDINVEEEHRGKGRGRGRNRGED